MFPIRPGEQNYLSGTMGELRSSHFHAGIDIKTGGVEGLPVYAAADGYVSRIKVDGGGYGNALYIAHPQLGTTTVYAHLRSYNDPLADYIRAAQYRNESFEVELFPGSKAFPVKKGDVIGYSGNSGSSGGPHLHFEIRDSAQRPLNPLNYRFDEVKDNIAPVVQRFAIKTLDDKARVNGQFGFFEFDPRRVGSDYYYDAPIAVHGRVGILLMMYDQLNGAANRNGVPHIQVAVDGREVMDIEIDKIPFSKSRQILQYSEYAVKQQHNRTFQKVYKDDGISLDFYTNSINGGALNITDTALHQIDITMADAYRNETTLHFTLKGVQPQATIAQKAIGAQPGQPRVFDNTLVFMGEKAQNNGYFARLYANRLDYRLAPAYYAGDLAVYLWDLRKGLPDSIDICGTVVKPGLSMMVPSVGAFSYYTDHLDVHFKKSTLFDTLYLQTNYINTDSQREYFVIGSYIQPLMSSMTVHLKPQLQYPHKAKTSAYGTQNERNFGYEGGYWSGEEFIFTTRSLGKYTLLADTLAPTVKIIEQNSNSIRAYISDDLSGIKDYSMRVNGQWVLMNYDPKRNYIWSEKRDPSHTFTGAVELTVRDNVGNAFTYSSQIP
jgi:hypothetical protein